MEKDINLNPKYIISTLIYENLYYFNSQLFRKLFKLTSSRAYQLINSLKQKELILEIENGKYLVLGFEKEKVLSNALFIASNIVKPSYITYWSALNYHGFTEQVPRQIFVATTKQKKNIERFKIRFVKIIPNKLFGFEKHIGGSLSYVIANKEKSLIDSIDLPIYAGGINEVIKSINNAKHEIDLDKVVEYANRMKSKSLCSRLGYICENVGIELKGLNTSKSYIKLDQEGARKGKYNSKWRVIDNVNT